MIHIVDCHRCNLKNFIFYFSFKNPSLVNKKETSRKRLKSKSTWFFFKKCFSFGAQNDLKVFKKIRIVVVFRHFRELTCIYCIVLFQEYQQLHQFRHPNFPRHQFNCRPHPRLWFHQQKTRPCPQSSEWPLRPRVVHRASSVRLEVKMWFVSELPEQQ